MSHFIVTYIHPRIEGGRRENWTHLQPTADFLVVEPARIRLTIYTESQSPGLR